MDSEHTAKRLHPRTQAFALALLALVLVRAQAQDNAPNADYYRYFFAFPLRDVIHQPDHFGIANGSMSVGIHPDSVCSLSGLYAPPFVSSDFRFTVLLDGEAQRSTSGAWNPNFVSTRRALNPVQLDAHIGAMFGQRALLITLVVTPRDGRKTVHLSGEFAGSLETNAVWEFARPQSSEPTLPILEERAIKLSQNDLALVLAWEARNDGMAPKVGYDSTTGRWTCALDVNSNGVAAIRFAVAVGKAGEAEAAAERAFQSNIYTIEDDLAARVGRLLETVPRFSCDNSKLERLYNRSLVHAVTNRWEISDFKLYPYYSTGSINGGCLCNYLWNFGEVWEILPIIEPEAVKSHITQFLAVDLTRHFAFLPITGEGFGPWYMVNQEKIIGLVYYYVMVTGDADFLSDTVNGRSILEHIIEHATFRDDAAKPVALIDYGPSNSHLELRKDLKYNHVMPDLNGRRYNNFVFAAKLAELAGTPRPDLLQRAEALRHTLHAELWDPQAKWFAFRNERGEKELRFTCQTFKLFNSGVLTDESLSGLLSLWNDGEFLGEYGLHSLAKGDPAYDENDVDNGGPGACTCFPPQIMERLYKSGHAADADALLSRILWWGEKLPYWGDSLYADRPDYRKDTPLQCTLDGLTVAQMVIFGLFGITPHADGSITINPHLPPLCTRMELSNVNLRGYTFDVRVDGNEYRVTGVDDTRVYPVGTQATLPPR